jgi:hypothetical protein
VRTLAPDRVIEVIDDSAAHRAGVEDQARNASCDSSTGAMANNV